MSKLTLEIPAETPLMDIARMAASIGCRVEARPNETLELVPERGCKVIPLSERAGHQPEPDQPA